MLISVIMLMYNREKLVRNAIQSIINQTFRNFEFIIIDNGSTDNSRSIAEEYMRQDDRIQVYAIDKSSIGKARNIGLQYAKGEYITFIDDDDFADTDMLEFFYKNIEQYDADIVICGTNIGTSADDMHPNQSYNKKYIMMPEKAVYYLLERKLYNAGFPGKCIKDSIMRCFPFEEHRQSEDIATSYKVLASSRCTVAHGVPKYNILRHSNNNSLYTTDGSKWTPELLDDYFEVYSERTAWLSDKLPQLKDYTIYSEWSFLISMCNKINRYNLKDCSAQLEYVMNILKSNKDEFLNSEYIKDFEREWMELYI